MPITDETGKTTEIDPKAAGSADVGTGGDGGAPAPVDEGAKALAALDEGLAQADGAPPEKPKEDDADADGDADEGAETETEGAAAETQPGADGKPADDPAAVEAAAKAKVDADAAALAAKAAAEKPADPVNDPIPEGTKGKTRERMVALINRVKSAEATSESAIRDRDDLLGMVQETGATPEQFSSALTYLKLVNSKNPEDRKKALELVLGDIESLALSTGAEVPGVDLLAKHADLAKAVENGEMTRKYALEVARARVQETARAAREPVLAEEAQREELRRHAQKAVGDLNALEAELKTRDGAVYDAKRAALVAVMKPIMATMHPSEWAKRFREAYDALKLPAAAVPAPAGAAAGNGKANQPLRPRQPAGQMPKAATSALEALTQGIESAGAR